LTHLQQSIKILTFTETPHERLFARHSSAHTQFRYY
jgi:hypothetical protein